MDYIKESDLLAEAISKIEFLEKEKENRAAELYIANLELIFQNREKERRADELVIANKELAFQNTEKDIWLYEMVIANKELAFQNKENEKRADELVIANVKLHFQNKEKEKRTADLILVNKQLAVQKVQLEDFVNIVSHNLRGPLINISMLVDDIAETNEESEMGILRDQLKITTANLGEIFDELIESLQVKKDTEIKSKKINLNTYLKKICDSLRGQINRSKAVIEFDFDESPLILFPPKYVYSIFQNLISNSLKYQSPERTPLIKIRSKRKGGKILLSVADNGLGIDLKKHKKDLFKIRKVFHDHPDAKGFGLFITKSQIEAMNGRIWAKSMPGVGSTFYVEFSNQNL